MSCSYHPQTNGQTERLNQCLETYLQYFVNANPNQWEKWLSLKYWYNTYHHSALGRSPFEVLYGRQPRHFWFQQGALTRQTELDAWLKDHAQMLPVIRQHLETTQLRIKRQANKHKLERSSAVGDWVYLKLQPYVQTSIATCSSQKLGFKYFSPYQVTKRAGSMSYNLKLPEGTHIHLVVHVSQLKKSVCSQDKVSTDLPATML
jgi:hypothetical protein